MTRFRRVLVDITVTKGRSVSSTMFLQSWREDVKAHEICEKLRELIESYEG